MRFKDRTEAGKQLAQQLTSYKGDTSVIVLGLPRGGVVTAFEVAKILEAPLDIIAPRKLGAPYNEELAVGAVGPDGSLVFNEDVLHSLGLHVNDLKGVIDAQRREASRRMKTYRRGRPALNLVDKTVILVDDGIATGATMRAAIASVRALGAKKIIVAAPVAPPSIISQLKPKVDELVCLYTTDQFWGVGQFYDQFEQVKDYEVIKILNTDTKTAEVTDQSP